MYKNIIFDLDGTILNTLDDLADAVNYACEVNGFHKYDIFDVKAMIGNGIGNLVARAIPNGKNNDKYTDVLSTFFDYYSKHLLDKTQPYIGCLDTLRELKRKGIKLFVVTNKRNSFANKLVSNFYDDTFLLTLGEDADCNLPRKPDPTIVNLILEKYNLCKKETLFVGDSDVDKYTADNSGLDCCLVTYGFKAKDFLVNLNAKFTIDIFSDLLNIVL